MAARTFRFGGKDVPYREVATFETQKDAFAELRKMETEHPMPLDGRLCQHTCDGRGWAVYEKLDTGTPAQD
jgi:hypothetical protein